MLSTFCNFNNDDSRCGGSQIIYDVGWNITLYYARKVDSILKLFQTIFIKSKFLRITKQLMSVNVGDPDSKMEMAFKKELYVVCWALDVVFFINMEY